MNMQTNSHLVGAPKGKRISTSTTGSETLPSKGGFERRRIFDCRVAAAGLLAPAVYAFGILILAVSGGLADDKSPAAGRTGEAPAKQAEAAFADKVKPFLTTYCNRCHGAEEQKGERRFDVLSGRIADSNDAVDLQDILDQLNLGEMPPEGQKQPTSSERRMVVAWLTNYLKSYHASRQGEPSQTILRRLNAREYKNTVRDLLGLNMTMFDPTATFPRDQTKAHLDNDGQTLVTSGYLLAQYLAAAEQVIDRALLPHQKPAVQKWAFRDGFRQQPEIDQVHRKTNRFEHMTLYDVVGADKHEGAYGPIHAFREGAPHDGYYKIRLKAEALHRINPYDPDFLGRDPSEPLRLGVVAGNYLVGALHKPQPIEPLLAEVDLADENKWYELRVWLDQGYTPRFVFRNGLMDARSLWSRLLRKYPKQFPKLKTRGIVEARFTAIKYGKLPQIHIHEIEIEGPFYEQWPTASQRILLGPDCESILAKGEISDKQIRQQLRTFAAQAHRRAVSTEELDRYLAVVQSRRKSGRSSLEAYADGLKAVLCSPKFLYLESTTAGTAKADGKQDDPAASPSNDVSSNKLSSNGSSSNELSSTALAARLSYFLWSSTPDQALRDLAAQGKLNDPAVLNAEVERMLKDPKSDAFISGFLDAWIHLRELGATPPDRGRFRNYYHYDLKPAMRRETQMFTRHLLEENLSIGNFLDSDFAFVDKRLAKLYDLPAPPGGGFQKVSLTDRRRGGLLGQASVLTVTANGIDTSPVTRGVWLMENILGSPPSPPPPDVEPLDPDIRGAKTIREQLKKHRNIESCNDCHRKMDPLGFALENFDPIGRWRTSYGRNAKVDASGTLPNGKSFKDITGLKRILLEQQEPFARALASKLLSYAIGRQLGVADRPHVDRILEKIGAKSGFRDLIKQVVLSKPFAAR